MSFTAAVFESISGEQARYHSVGVHRMVDTLVKRYGSNVQAARAIGVSEAAIRRWKKGAAPRDRQALVSAYRVVRMDPGREARLRAGDFSVVLTQNGSDGDPERSRLIKASGLRLAPGTMDRAVDAYLDGDDLGAAAAVHAGITDDFYKAWITDDFTEFPEIGEDDPYALY